jgi:putative ABC transport system permease protein
MNTLLQDLRYGLRMLAKSPGFTAVAVVTLALGIGANTAIVSVVNAVLVRPLPYRDPSRLAQVNETIPSGPYARRWFAVAPGNFLDWKQQNHVFEDMAVLTGPANATLSGGAPETVQAQRVSANFFPLLGVQPVLGRTFSGEEDRPSGEPVVVLSYGLWQRRFGSDPSVVGRSLTLDGKSHTMIGVMPKGFRFFPRYTDQDPDLWLPYPFENDPPNERVVHRLQSIGRLKPGVSIEQAQAEMDTIAYRLAFAYPKSNADFGVNVVPLHLGLVEDFRPALLLLMGAVGFVLLIACANVASLLLARGVARQKEIAVRAALGAGRGRLIRQLLTESVLLGMLGGVLGLLLALWGIEVFAGRIPGDIPRKDMVAADPAVLCFTLLASLLTGLLLGVAPAVGASKPDLNQSLKEGGRWATAGVGQERLRSLLVVVEVALALVLVIGGGLMINSFLRLQKVNLGFDPENVLALQVGFPKWEYTEYAGLGTNEKEYTKGLKLWRLRPEWSSHVEQVRQRIEHLPGIVSVGVTSFLPRIENNMRGRGFSVEGRPAADVPPFAYYRPVTSDYFRTMGIRLMEGRYFSAAESERASGAVIINKLLAQQLFPHETPIGQHLRTKDGGEDHDRVLEVVGVVADVKVDLMPDPDDPAGVHTLYVTRGEQAETFVDWAIGTALHVTFVARTATNPAVLIADVRKVVGEVDSDLPIEKLAPLEELIGDSTSKWRFYTTMLTILAAVGLALAAVGIYGVVSYSVTRRTHEIGVRMALGAERRDVLKMVLRQGLGLVAIGVLAGLTCAFVLTRLLASLLYEVRPTDPLTFVSVSLFLLGVALLACYIPARRATKVDPMVALRYE